MDVRFQELAEEQGGVVGWWQLRDAGMSERAVMCAVADLRQIHDGVWVTGHAPITDHQRWLGATLTTRDSALTHASAAACHGFWPWELSVDSITRPGSGGPRLIGSLWVYRSATLAPWVTLRDGIRIAVPARVIIDLAAQSGPWRLKRMLREALRQEVLTVAQLQVALVEHRGRRGTRFLCEVAATYARLQIERARSDPEAYAQELLLEAGLFDGVLVNVDIEGEEADLVWPERRLIIEIDGGRYHQFFDEDARKQAKWEAADWTVRRIPSDDVYDNPHKLIALARQPTPNVQGLTL